MMQYHERRYHEKQRRSVEESGRVRWTPRVLGEDFPVLARSKPEAMEVKVEVGRRVEGFSWRNVVKGLLA
jgi:hypothetical protein